MPVSQQKEQSGALCCRRVFVKFEDLSVVHVAGQLLRLFAKLIYCFGLGLIFQEKLLDGVTLELVDQLFDRFSAIMCPVAGLQIDSVIDVAWGFPDAAECALVI